MFDGIYFKEFDNDHGTDSRNVAPYNTDPRPNQSADYEYDSQIQYLPPIPISQFARDNYLYVQNFGLFKSNKSYFTRRQNFSSYEIGFTYEGAGILEYEGRTYHMTPGKGFFIDCKKPHFYKTEKQPWVHSDFHFYGHLAEALYAQYAHNKKVVFHSADVPSYQVRLEKILRLFDSLSYYIELQISNELHQLLTELIVNTGKSVHESFPLAQNLKYLQFYMQNNYQSDLSLDFLAKFSGISKYHLCREFKRYTGFTPNDYLNRVRLEQAKSLLTSTTLPIYKIAQLVGIPNENTFMYHFKKDTGITPSEFRKHLRA